MVVSLGHATGSCLVIISTGGDCGEGDGAPPGGYGTGGGGDGGALAESANAATCCICLGEYGDGELLTSMPCEHVFHGACLEKWLARSRRCPMCNSECC